jgi:hypothetical protein
LGGGLLAGRRGEGERIEHLRAVAAPAGVVGGLVWGGRLGGLCGEVGTTGVGIVQVLAEPKFQTRVFSCIVRLGTCT